MICENVWSFQSKTRAMKRGVPQGSGLGPIRFFMLMIFPLVCEKATQPYLPLIPQSTAL